MGRNLDNEYEKLFMYPRGGGRTGNRSGDQGNDRIDGQGGQGSKVTKVEVDEMVGIRMAMLPMTTSGVMISHGGTLKSKHEVRIRYRFYELARLVPHLVTPEGKRIERYVYGLASQIQRMVTATKPTTIQKAVQIAGTLTDEVFRNGSIKKNPEKRGNKGEPSNDRNVRDDNKRTRTVNAFATTTNAVERENTGHFARDCRVVPKNVNPINTRNPTVRGSYEYGSTDHIKNQGNQAKGRAFMLGAEEARQDPNVMTEVKGMSSSSTSTQNMAFVSSSNNNSTNRVVNTAQGINTAIRVSTADTQVNTANIDNLSDVVICAFLASQPSSPQLVNEDLEQIYLDDLEEMDLKWKMAMLTMRARRFLKKIRRKLTVNGNETIRFDKTNVECYNYHKRGHFAREYRAPRSQDTKHKESTKKIVHVETPASTTLVSCDGLGDEFANKPVAENSKAESSQEKPKEVRKNTDALIIKEWVSDDEDGEMIQPKFKQKTVKTSITKIEFVKPKQPGKKARKTIKQGNPQIDLQDKGVINSGCSRHMIGNMSYLTDYKEINRGYAAIEVVTDDYSRFTRVFFLTTKDETTGILKSFINRIENLVDHKVNVIRCDNGTEFKNREMNQFYEMKGSGPDWLFNIDALTRTMNYEPIAAGTQSNGFAGTKARDNAGQARKETEPVNEDPSKGSKCKDQEQEDNVNSTNNVNVASRNRVNTVSENISSELPFDSDMPALEDISTFNFSNDHEDDDELADMNNLDTTIQDERGIMIRNKATLVAQGHTQEERIDYDEVFVPVLRIEAIRLFLAYASFKDFVVCQINVKSAFLYGKNEKEVYVCQPPGFEDPNFLDRLYMVEKSMGLCIAFKKLMHEKFQMSSMGELTFFLGLQVKQKNDGIFISQDKYVGEILKKIGFTEVKNASTPMETQKPLLKNEDGEEVDVHMYRSMNGSLMYLTSSRPDIMFIVCACTRYQVNPKVSHLHVVKRIFRYLKGHLKLGLWYVKDSLFYLVTYTDSDYAEASLDMKSTIGGCQYLKSRLISWQYKKQTVVVNSTTEAEYVAASSCYGQLLWIQNQLLDYGYNFMHTKILIDNKSTICGGPKSHDTMSDTIAQTRFERVSKLSNDLLLVRGNTLQSDEDSMKLNELMELCITLQSRVLDLEQTRTTQANKIDSLKKRVKKLKKKQRSRTHKLKRLYKVGLTARVESSDDEQSLGDDASKLGRISDIDADEGITLVSTHDDAEMFDADKDLHGEEVFVAKQDENVVEKEVNAVQVQVSTAATTAIISIDEKRRKFFAAKRAEEKRNKPPTQAQQRKIMYTYLKKTELVEDSSKRVGEKVTKESAKKQKIDDDKEIADLKQLMKIIPEEEIEIDAIPLAVKSSIIDWKIYK
uniref:Reverse transcriptase Ty1/copia-type domain-containing protein n=1 Tax=Tanacetum cinerariifolium TaxID=118510 RepID=A0A6L2M3Q7_TANCI|nr:hypothetical protein [Tanacetum cinerariifolium]